MLSENVILWDPRSKEEHEELRDALEKISREMGYRTSLTGLHKKYKSYF